MVLINQRELLYNELTKLGIEVLPEQKLDHFKYPDHDSLVDVLDRHPVSSRKATIDVACLEENTTVIITAADTNAPQFSGEFTTFNVIGVGTGNCVP